MALALWRLLVPFALALLGWGMAVDWLLERLALNRPVLDSPTARLAYGLLLVALFVLGLILAYNLGALVYRVTRGPVRVTVHAPAEPRPGATDALLRYQRIGLILAGGGAKGAYQAGAMRAIWEFLEEHRALDRVRMVAGTSIGAWNAMFWLAGLVRPPAPEAPSAHAAWWRAVKPERILDFDWYFPFAQNHFARPTPWRAGFRRLFSDPAAVRDRLAGLLAPRPRRDADLGPPSGAGGAEPIHFYFTRSNVGEAVLEFTTNAWGVADLRRPDPRTGRPTPIFQPSLYHVLDGGDPAGALRELEDAVFASMDIPPVFPLMRMETPGFGVEWFEDGGVIDNLPMLFGTQVEACDLLFVLPLNATFLAPVRRHSILARLSRVMEARQGVIERNAFKLAYLYNDLHQAKGQRGVTLFAISPAEPLAVGTLDFHKRREAAAAYQLMYEETATELRQEFARLSPDWIRLATVGPRGERDYIEEF